MDDNFEKQGVANTSTAASTNANDYDEKVGHWLNLCMVGVAGANIATAMWLQLSCAAVGLHSSHIRSNSTERYCVRTNLVKYITTSEQRCRDMLRLSCSAFDALVGILKTKGRVKHYSRGTIEEQLVTFLLILGHNFKNRVVSVLFCRSGETISRYFHNILEAVILLEEDFVKPWVGDKVQPTILNSSRFFPYFKDCLGAIDGTHVRVKVSPINAPRYRGRKDWPTQNVLAACTFDLKFAYILAGWEGSAADSRVLQSAMTRDEPFVIPEGKFYLGDAGFGLSSKIVTPFGRTRYHLKEYSNRPPETAEELFNHRHSSLRNAIERAFGVLKKRFPIMASGAECHFASSTMTDVVLACVVLHNFILCHDEMGDGYSHQEDLFQTDIEDLMGDNEGLPLNGAGVNTGEELQRGQELRRTIASAMWDAYCVNRAANMGTPNRGKMVAAGSPDASPRCFRWTQPFEDTLLELLLRESRQGNRPDSTFTASAFRSVVADFNRIHGTSIMKKHILSRIKTMKSHFVAFHGAFNGLSGFSWNERTKMFEAEDEIWDQRIKDNPKLEKFRYRTCHNWDMLCELYGDTRATGNEARGMKEKAKSIKRTIAFEDDQLETPGLSTSEFPMHDTSSYGDCEFSNADAAGAKTQDTGSIDKSDGSSKKKQKQKAAWVSIMEDGYKTVAESIHELSIALKGTGEKVAGSKYDVQQNSEILQVLSSLGLEEKYKLSCYFYLSANPSKAALLVAATEELRAACLEEIMKAAKGYQS